MRLCDLFRKFLPVVLILSGLNACDTASNVEDPDLHYFMKYYGGEGNQYGVDMVALPDGSFVLLGNFVVNAFEAEIYLVRVDAEGEIIWEKRFSDEGNNDAKDIEPSLDGNFIVLADYQTAFGEQMDFKILKISPDGDLLNSQVLGHAIANDFSSKVTVLSDGGFIVSGTTEATATFQLVNNPDPDFGDFFNYRLDQDFNSFSENDWNPVTPGFGGKLDVAVKAVEVEVLEAGVPVTKYYVFGYSNINLNDTNPNRKEGLFYFKRDLDGKAVNPFYPGNAEINNDTRIHFVEAVPDEMSAGFIVVGTSRDSQNQSKIFIAKMRNILSFDKFESDISLYTTLPLGRNIRGISVASSLTNEFGYLILGEEVRAGATNFWLSKIDQSGQILWSTTFGSEAEDDYGAAVAQLPDGKIAVLGTIGLADNQFKMALIKLNPKGQLLK